MSTVPIIPKQKMKEAPLAAARVGDMHTCPMVEPGPTPHVGGPVLKGSANVFIEGMPAAREGDPSLCTGPADKIAKGSATVYFNGKAAARMTDTTAHGGVIVKGAAKTYVGDGPGKEGDPSDCMEKASAEGSPTISAA